MKTTIVRQASRGKLLVSEPFLSDPCFKRTVVLLSEHNEEGTIGFILNKPTEINLNDGVQDFPDFNAPLYFGGPVHTDTLHYIHKFSAIENAKEIIPGLYWGGNIEQLKMMIDTGQVKPGEIRFYAGYSGWMPNQLNSEIREKSWIISPASAVTAFSSNPGVMWSEVLKSMGKEYAVIANFPEDPGLN
jgi:putative transcriptional regulator